MNKTNGNINGIKVIAIFMILTLHYMNAEFGGVLGNVNEGTENYYIAWIIESACIIAVNLFVLASAYHLSDSTKGPKFYKVIKLLCISYGYGILFWIIGYFIGLNEISIQSFAREVNPLLNGKYWFVLAYIIMYLIYPYLNIILNNLNKKQHRYLVAMLGIFFSVWPSFLPYGPSNDYGYGIISFILLYFIGSYVKRYCEESLTKLGCFSTYLFCVTIVVFFSMFKGTWSPLSYNFIFNIIGSVAFFNLFLKFNINSNWVNIISKHTFSIYIIHLNSVILNVVIYKILNISNFYNSKYMVIHLIFSILLWFLTSIFIDLVFTKSIGLLNKRGTVVNKLLKRLDKIGSTLYC